MRGWDEKEGNRGWILNENKATQVVLRQHFGAEETILEWCGKKC